MTDNCNADILAQARAMTHKVGWDNGNFIADLHMNVPDAVMREQWRAGEYDTSDGRKPHPQYVTQWRAFAGRKNGDAK